MNNMIYVERLKIHNSVRCKRPCRGNIEFGHYTDTPKCSHSFHQLQSLHVHHLWMYLYAEILDLCLQTKSLFLKHLQIYITIL